MIVWVSIAKIVIHRRNVEVSGFLGANLVERSEDLPWYDGPTLMQVLAPLIGPQDQRCCAYVARVVFVVCSCLRSAEFKGWFSPVLGSEFSEAAFLSCCFTFKS